LPIQTRNELFNALLDSPIHFRNHRVYTMLSRNFGWRKAIRLKRGRRQVSGDHAGDRGTHVAGAGLGSERPRSHGGTRPDESAGLHRQGVVRDGRPASTDIPAGAAGSQNLRRGGNSRRWAPKKLAADRAVDGVFRLQPGRNVDQIQLIPAAFDGDQQLQASGVVQDFGIGGRAASRYQGERLPAAHQRSDIEDFIDRAFVFHINPPEEKNRYKVPVPLTKNQRLTDENRYFLYRFAVTIAADCGVFHPSTAM